MIVLDIRTETFAPQTYLYLGVGDWVCSSIFESLLWEEVTRVSSYPIPLSTDHRGKQSVPIRQQ